MTTVTVFRLVFKVIGLLGPSLLGYISYPTTLLDSTYRIWPLSDGDISWPRGMAFDHQSLLEFERLLARFAIGIRRSSTASAKATGSSYCSAPGYRIRIVLELEAPNPEAEPDLAAAIDYYRQAKRRYAEGEWRLTVECLRQSLASIVGKKAENEEREADVQDSFKAVRSESRDGAVGYERRAELVRQAASSCATSGPIPR